MKEAAVAGKDIEDNKFNVYSASIRCWVMHLYHPQFQEPLLCHSGSSRRPLNEMFLDSQEVSYGDWDQQINDKDM